MVYKMKGFSYPGKSPAKQKSTESAHGQLNDAEREYQEDLKRVKMTKSEEDKDKYWYKINGKKTTKAEYIKYQNKPGGDEPGKTTNDPDVYGRKASNFGRGPKTKK
jgi:hypothetical protein